MRGAARPRTSRRNRWIIIHPLSLKLYILIFPIIRGLPWSFAPLLGEPKNKYKGAPLHLHVHRWDTQGQFQGHIVLSIAPGERCAPFCRFFLTTEWASSCFKILMALRMRKIDPITGPARSITIHMASSRRIDVKDTTCRSLDLDMLSKSPGVPVTILQSLEFLLS